MEAHVVQPNEWVPAEVTPIEFKGQKLVEYSGDKGSATVFKTEKGKLAVYHDQWGFPGKVFRVHTQLSELVKFTRGNYPIYDYAMIVRVAEALGMTPPPIQLDI